MARNQRQDKILQIIQNFEIEKQEDLVKKLQEENYNITQATISRDIKELGLIKVMTNDKKYKYACPDIKNEEDDEKGLQLFKNCSVSIHIINNCVLVKTIKNFAQGVASIIKSFSMDNVLGVVNGDDAVSIIFDSNSTATTGFNFLNKLYYG